MQKILDRIDNPKDTKRLTEQEKIELAKEIREEKKSIRKSLGEVLKENRLRCKMTQEFVSETLGVSRQAVSKWENGTSDPSTSNLIAIAELYGVSSEELLRSTNAGCQKNSKEKK